MANTDVCASCFAGNHDDCSFPDDCACKCHKPGFEVFNRPKQTTCPDCGRDDFATPAGLTVHRAAHRRAAEEAKRTEPACCDECGAEFTTALGVVRHAQRAHPPERPRPPSVADSVLRDEPDEPEALVTEASPMTSSQPALTSGGIDLTTGIELLFALWEARPTVEAPFPEEDRERWFHVARVLFALVYGGPFPAAPETGIPAPPPPPQRPVEQLCWQDEACKRYANLLLDQLERTQSWGNAGWAKDYCERFEGLMGQWFQA